MFCRLYSLFTAGRFKKRDMSEAGWIMRECDRCGRIYFLLSFQPLVRVKKTYLAIRFRRWGYSLGFGRRRSAIAPWNHTGGSSTKFFRDQPSRTRKTQISRRCESSFTALPGCFAMNLLPLPRPFPSPRPLSFWHSSYPTVPCWYVCPSLLDAFSLYLRNFSLLGFYKGDSLDLS